MPYVRTRLGRLFYEERGEIRRKGDPTIVLLHGLLFDGGMWRDQVEPLAAISRLIVIDGPGHGKSELPPHFTLEEHADALAEGLLELGASPVVLVGHSWGGMVAARFALQHPGKLAGIALLNTTSEHEPLVSRLRSRALVAMHRLVGMPYGVYTKEVVPLQFAPRSLRDRPELLATLDSAYERAMSWEREGVARAVLAVIRRTSILDKLGAIRTKVLVMCGREDLATPLGKSDAIVRRVHGARLIVLEGLGHMSPLEDSAAVNVELVPFVRGIVDAAPTYT